MKQGIGILNGYKVWPGLENFAKRMKEELAKYGIAFSTLSNARILSYLDQDGSIKGTPLEASFILFLDKDHYTAKMLEARGYHLYNSARAIELCDDKMLTYITLANQGIKMPKTISGPLDYAKESNDTFIKELQKQLDFPMVAKTSFGSQGSGVTLVHNVNELKETETQLCHEPRLYQSFIASSFGEDYRLIVIGGHYLTGMRRKNNNGDFRSNIAQGGIGEKVVIPPSFIMMAEKVASILGLDYCGVDLLKGPHEEPILCEVNSNAFMEGIEKATGVNVAGAYAKLINEEVFAH